MRIQIKVIKRIFLIILLGCVLGPGKSFAQHYLDIKAQADTNRIRIGEHVKLQLSARVQLEGLKGASFKVFFPSLPDSFSHFEVINRTNLDTITSEGEKFFHQTVTLSSYDSGRWEIPALKFEVFSITDGSYDSVFTQPVMIDVNTVAVDTTKAFKPIKAVQGVSWNLLDYWLYLVLGALTALVIVGLILYFRKKPVKAPVVAGPSEVPYDRAMRELQELKSEKLWEQGDVKQYYTRLTDILRTYFENQFGIAALEQTSAELLQNIKPVTILNQQREKLQTILIIADLAKFAKMQPTPQEHEDCMTKATEIVAWTKPAAAKEVQPGEAGKA
jgi:hypothetical protein